MIRRAAESDLAAIVGLLVDDPIGASPESADESAMESYRGAFAETDGDPSELLIVATVAGEVAATLQLSFLPGLSRRGTRRAGIEAVRVRDGERGRGLGTLVVEWAIAEARRRDCGLVQLTTDKRGAPPDGLPRPPKGTNPTPSFSTRGQCAVGAKSATIRLMPDPFPQAAPPVGSASSPTSPGPRPTRPCAAGSNAS